MVEYPVFIIITDENTMIDTLLNFLGAGGIMQLSTGELLLTGLLLTQVTIFGVTIYLHRNQAHRALDLHPVIAHFFRFWLWLTTGMVTREWVAIHRKHHAKCETPDDPHSPQVLGIGKVMWQGAELYRQEAGRHETLARYGHLTPDDWLERHVYARFPLAWHHAYAVARYRAVRHGRSGVVGGADDMDPVLGGRRDQRCGPLLGLPQLRELRTPPAISCRGA